MSAHARKQHGASFIDIAAADPAPLVNDAWRFACARGSLSTARREWKVDIERQLQRQVEGVAPAGPLDVQVGLRCSGLRNWAYLWKPVIDCLSCVVGADPGGREFHPADDRITVLGMHRTIDERLGWDTEVAVWWRGAS